MNVLINLLFVLAFVGALYFIVVGPKAKETIEISGDEIEATIVEEGDIEIVVEHPKGKEITTISGYPVIKGKLKKRKEYQMEMAPYSDKIVVKEVEVEECEADYSTIATGTGISYVFCDKDKK